MAIISEIQEPIDDSLERVDLVDYNSSDFDEFLSDAEVAPTNEDNAAYTPTPEVTVTINMESDEAKKDAQSKEKYEKTHRHRKTPTANWRHIRLLQKERTPRSGSL